MRYTIEIPVTVQVEYFDTMEDPLMPGQMINRYYVVSIDDSLPSQDEIIRAGDYGIYTEED